MVFEYVYDLILRVYAESPSATVYGKLVSDIQDGVFVNEKSIEGVCKYVTGWTEAWGSDPAENSGNFVALHFDDTNGAVNTVRTIGGFHDDRIAECGDDKYVVLHVKNNATKIVIRSVLNGGTANEEVIEKTLSCSGLKLNKA